MNVAFLCLGGNIGERKLTLQKAIDEINSKVGTVISSSPIYETEAWGVENHNSYLNQCIFVHTKLKSNQLIHALLTIEKEMGRIRTQSATYEARTIDIDILFYNNECINEDNLIVPHPRLHLRKFVLIPLNDIAPQHVHPIFNKTVHNLLEECPDNSQVFKHTTTK